MEASVLPDRLKRIQSCLIKPGDLCLFGGCSAPSNIALVKYWGKKKNQIPDNSSVSMTLGGFRSSTKVEINNAFGKTTYKLCLNKNVVSPSSKIDNFIRMFFGEVGYSINITSENNFPTACGIASSASGFAALVGAFADALDVEKKLEKKDFSYWMSEWTRLGSGSSTRSSIVNPSSNFIAWKLRSNLLETETCEVKVHEMFSEFGHCVVVFNQDEKKVSSSEGHAFANTSPFYSIRLASIEEKFASIIDALGSGDFGAVKDITEMDALNVHSIMQTSSVPSVYLMEEQSEFLYKLVNFRNSERRMIFWTMDAGPNVHILFSKQERKSVEDFLDNNLKLGCVSYFNESFCGILMGQKNSELCTQNFLTKRVCK